MRKQQKQVAVDLMGPQANIRVARALAQLVKGSGLTTAEIAERGGITKPAVWHWLSSPRPYGIDTLARVAEILGYKVQLVFERV